MESNRYKPLVKELLSLANIEINGSNQWRIQMHDERFYKRAIGEVECGNIFCFRARVHFEQE